MEELRETILEAAPLYLAWGGFVIGVVFGFVVQQTNFCAMGSISDIMSFEDYRRFRSWLLAAAVAVAGTQALSQGGIVDLGLSMYLGASVNWLGNTLGGLLFGIGMVFAGGCTSRNLVRVGGGDLRAAVVLIVVGITAYMTIGGILGPTRAWLESHTAVGVGDAGSQSMAALLAATGIAGEETLSLVVAALIVAAIGVYCFMDASFRSSPKHIIGGVGVGLCIVAGWALTGLAYDDFADSPQNPLSLSYVRPAGDTLEYLQRFTAGRVPGFGVATVFGALAGALAAALVSGKFQLQGFADSGDTVRNVAGGALMGVGGITALGCTIGQSVTGLSTLALGSLITFVAIVIGGVIGMKWMERILLG
ncbi:MAG: YeeE/YedE family protein [Gammaproteobacteria bacterium]